MTPAHPEQVDALAKAYVCERDLTRCGIAIWTTAQSLPRHTESVIWTGRGACVSDSCDVWTDVGWVSQHNTPAQSMRAPQRRLWDPREDESRRGAA